jgi:flavin reductase (DIM6/NTAB) family NADH-FMN oxidoreductase RutF
MEKISLKTPSNKFCPQTLFLYGTYKEDGTPNFGLFCWMSYFWDSELGVMACIGSEKRKVTKDRIRATNVFSANLVTESLLPLADYLGSTGGYKPGKMDIAIDVEQGKVLQVPVLKNSPWVFELEVKQSIPLDGSDVFFCKIRNVLAAKELADETKSIHEGMRFTAPVTWIGGSGAGQYFFINPDSMANTGQLTRENLSVK